MQRSPLLRCIIMEIVITCLEGAPTWPLIRHSCDVEKISHSEFLQGKTFHADDSGSRSDLLPSAVLKALIYLYYRLLTYLHLQHQSNIHQTTFTMYKAFRTYMRSWQENLVRPLHHNYCNAQNAKHMLARRRFEDEIDKDRKRTCCGQHRHQMMY